MRRLYKAACLVLMGLLLTFGTVVTAFGADTAMEYTGKAYCDVNKGIPYFTAAEKGKTYGFENYSRLDKLGRCGVAYVNVCKELMPTQKRGEIGSVKPSGWHTVKYNDLIDGNYLYNRCHLVGYQLAGENANVRNLITGTRYLNVEGMLPFENKVADYVEKTGNHVLYRVTPKFTGDNLVADGVLMEAWSVEDSGKGICFNVFCYNVQPGITINYLTGDSARSGEKVAVTSAKAQANKAQSAPKQTALAQADQVQTNKATSAYVANKNTKKFHYATCGSVNDMAEHNKLPFDGTRDQLIAQGYIPCKRCNP